jgi:autotransporter-associated beta strand protein
MSVVKLLRRFACPVVLSALSILASCAQVQATNVYFDLNGTTAGSGVAAAGAYTWEGTNWNTVAGGTGATAAWIEGDFPRFSAGSDANGKTYTVTATANHSFAGMFANTNSAGTVHINTSGGAILSITSGLQGFFSGTNSNLYIDAPLYGVDSTSQLRWAGGGGSLFLYGDNSNLVGGVQLDGANGLNFNSSTSFGPATTPITFGTSTTTSVLANPDVASVTIPNNLTMRSDANTTIIYAGKDVTFSGVWTIGSAAGGRFSKLQVGNTTFPSSKMTISNGILGDGSSNLTVQSPSPTGTTPQISSTLIVPAASTYGGITTLGQITGTIATPAAPATGTPALQATDGVGLPTNSILQLNGGVFQTNGTFDRPLGASGGHQVAWGWPTGSDNGNQTAPGGGGFSAVDGQLTVNIDGNGTPDELAWGEASTDVGSKILGPLKFGSGSSNNKTLWVNPVDLAGLGTANVVRTVTVSGGAGGDSSEMSGVIRNSGTTIGFTKNGTGTLILSATNTYDGSTTIGAGTLSIANVGNTGANSNIGTNGTIHLGSTVGTLISAGTLKYTGTGETSDKVLDLAATTGGGVIDQSGAGLLKFTSNLTATGAGAKTLTLQGSTAGTGELDGTIVDNGGATAVTKAGTGTWTLAGANTYTGTTAANAGILILGSANAMPSANALSLGGGTLRNSSGGVVTVGGATSLTTNSTIDGANGFTFNGAFTNTAAGNRTLTNNSSGPVTLGAVNLSNSGTARVVTIGGTGNTTINGLVANGSTSTTSGLTKSGNSTLTLANATGNTYGGTTTISSGSTLLANNSSGSATGTGGVTVSAGGFLGGTGSVSGAVTNSGTINGNNLTTGAVANSATGTLSPGGVGTVSILNVGGNLTDTGASTWAIDLSGATADKMAVTGNITLSGTDVLSLSGTGTGTSWIIGTYTGIETGAFGTIPSGYSVTYTGGNITLNVGTTCAPGDFNCDGHVDAGDYASIRKQYSDITTGAGLTAYTAWRQNFGSPPGAGSGGGLGAGGAVPEPSSIALLVCGLVAAAARRRVR